LPPECLAGVLYGFSPGLSIHNSHTIAETVPVYSSSTRTFSLPKTSNTLSRFSCRCFSASFCAASTV